MKNLKNDLSIDLRSKIAELLDKATTFFDSLSGKETLKELEKQTESLKVGTEKIFDQAKKKKSKDKDEL